MINGRSVVGLVVARGGSKGVPRKNVRRLVGKPLIAWTFDSAEKSRYLDRIVLSTEDDEIMAVAESRGSVDILRRPLELAADDVGAMPVVTHALDTLEESFDYIVLLQPTSPLRSADDIDHCIEVCEKRSAPACITLVESKPLSWMFMLSSDGKMRRVDESGEIAARRQDCPPVYRPNGAVYVAKSAWLRENGGFFSPETVGCPMPKGRSVDIDDEIDFRIAEMVLIQEGDRG